MLTLAAAAAAAAAAQTPWYAPGEGYWVNAGTIYWRSPMFPHGLLPAHTQPHTAPCFTVQHS
eukprot:1160402-Pelagomonas_calceolata.AAC.2